MKLYFLLSISILLFSTSLLARRPSVEPVVELSYEDLSPVKDPAKAKGLDLTHRQPINLKDAQPKRSLSSHKQAIENSDLSQEEVLFENNLPIFPFLIFSILLPFLVWITLVYNLKKNRSKELTNNTLEFPTKKDDSENDNDFNIPKAS